MTATYAALRKERRKTFTDHTTVHRKSGGAQWRDLQFRSTPKPISTYATLFPLVISTGAYPGFLVRGARPRPRMRLSAKRDGGTSPINATDPRQEIRGSAVERSAVPLHPKTNLNFRNPSSPLSSRPERTRISYLTALDDGHVCGSPQRETQDLHRSHHCPQEIRGSAVERSAVPLHPKTNLNFLNPSSPFVISTGA